jgi:cardiolipin synthase (CMP-forming)
MSKLVSRKLLLYYIALLNVPFLSTNSTEKFWTIPNILSLYRIVIFPFILYLIISRNEELFAIFITISLVTDSLDGIIARVFKMQTQIGAKLDSWADVLTYLLAFSAMYIFRWNDLKFYKLPIIIVLAAYVLSYVIMLLKFRHIIGLHTYLFKVTGYIQGAFIVLLFMYKFYSPLFYFSISLALLGCIEEIVILFILHKPRSNVKGLYWVLKDRR